MMVKILSILLLSSIFISCASNEKKKNILEVHASHFDQGSRVDFGFKNKKKNSNVALVWKHGAELPNGDYFWGGWISVVLEKPRWSIKRK